MEGELELSMEQLSVLEYAQNGNVEELRKLVPNISPNFNDSPKNKRSTPLHWSVAKGHLEATQYLVESGADVNARVWGGITPLHEAARNGRLEIAKFLVGIEEVQLRLVCNLGYTALRWAVDRNDNYMGALITKAIESRPFEKATWIYREAREASPIPKSRRFVDPVVSEREELSASSSFLEREQVLTDNETNIEEISMGNGSRNQASFSGAHEDIASPLSDVIEDVNKPSDDIEECGEVFEHLIDTNVIIPVEPNVNIQVEEYISYTEDQENAITEVQQEPPQVNQLEIVEVEERNVVFQDISTNESTENRATEPDHQLLLKGAEEESPHLTIDPVLMNLTGDGITMKVSGGSESMTFHTNKTFTELIVDASGVETILEFRPDTVVEMHRGKKNKVSVTWGSHEFKLKANDKPHRRLLMDSIKALTAHNAI